MFKDKLTNWRERQGLERTKLAEILDITYQGLAQLESGKNEPSIKFLKKFSKLSGLSLDELLEEDDIDDCHNAKKIQEIARKLRFTSKEIAFDIKVDRSEIRRILEDNAEPTWDIITKICKRYSIPISEFKRYPEKEYKQFVNADINREYIEASIYAKESGLSPQEIIKSVNYVKSIKGGE